MADQSVWAGGTWLDEGLNVWWGGARSFAAAYGQIQCLGLSCTRYWQPVIRPEQMCNLSESEEVTEKSSSSVMDALEGIVHW